MKFPEKAKHPVVIILLLVLVLFAIGKWYVLPMLTRYPGRPVYIRRGSNCVMVGRALRLFYQQSQGNVPEHPLPAFVTYLMAIETYFSPEAPVEGYKSEKDMSFYLFLPRKLESSSPLLIGYTDSFAKDKKVYRHTLFLQGTEISVFTLAEATLRGIVGREIFDNKEPDFYIWRLRSKYLEEQSGRSN